MRRALSVFALGLAAAGAFAQTPAWTRDFTFAKSNEAAVTVGVDSAGNVYSVGTRGLAPLRDILVVSYTPTGVLRWSQTYNGPVSKDDVPVEIAVDPATGDVYLVGMSFRGATENAMITQKYAGGTGVLEWTETHYYDDGFFGLVPCIAEGITLGPDGTLFACGSAQIFNEFEDAYVVSQNRATGAKINTHVFGTTIQPASYQSAKDIAFNGTDGVFVAVSTADNPSPYSPDASDLLIRRLTTGLTEVWTNTYDGYGKRDVARNIAVRGNDVFIFGNAATDPATYPVLFTVKANALTGAEVWRKLRSTASDTDTGKMVLNSFGDPTIVSKIDMFGGLAVRYRGTDGFLYFDRVLADQYNDFTVDGGAATYLVGPNTMKLSTAGATLWTSPQPGVSAAAAPGNVLYTNTTFVGASTDLRTMRWFQGAYAFTLTPSSTVGGVTVTGRLSVNQLAPVGGLTFNVAESSIYVSVPATVTIPAGATQVNFNVFTAPVKGYVNLNIPITATFNGITLTQTLTLIPPVPQSLVMSPATVTGGNPSTGTVTLTGKAPSTGLWVALSDNSTFVTTPNAVKVLANQTSANFGVTTVAVVNTQNVTITAKSNGVTRTATLTVNP